MTILSVQSEDEILLDGTRYRLRSRLTRQLVSVYPGKVVIGDTSRDSRPRTSILAYSDLRGGIGIERMKGARDADRVWWSTMDLSHDGHLVLPLRPVTLPRLPGSGDVTALGYLKGFIYVVFNRSVYKWDPATGWGNAVRTVDGIVHEVSTISIEDTTYLIVAHQEGTDYTTDGATWLSVGGVGTRDTSGDFTLGGNNSDPYAMIILTISSTDYILVGDRTDNKFYAYTKLGVRSATNDINSLPTSDLEGAAASDDYIFLLDSDAEKVFVINHAGVRQTGLDFDLDYVSSPTPRGIAVKSDGTTILIADRDERKAFAYQISQASGSRDPSRDFSPSLPESLVHVASLGDLYWGIGGTNRRKAYCFNGSGGRVSDNDLELPVGGESKFIASDGSTIWILDENTDKATAFESLDIVTDADIRLEVTLRSGEGGGGGGGGGGGEGGTAGADSATVGGNGGGGGSGESSGEDGDDGTQGSGGSEINTDIRLEVTLRSGEGGGGGGGGGGGEGGTAGAASAPSGGAAGAGGAGESSGADGSAGSAGSGGSARDCLCILVDSERYQRRSISTV